MIRKLLISLMVAIAALGTAQAALDPLEQALELGLDQVTLPAHSAGQVVVRECGDCSVKLMPVNSDTTYFLGAERRVSLRELQDAADGVRKPKLAGVYVFYEPETGVVTRIVLGLPG